MVENDAQADTETIFRPAVRLIWATINTGGNNRADGYGDHFLGVGESLFARQGQHLVCESTKGNLPVFFDFLPI